MIDLRPHQQLGIDMIKQSINAGNRKIVLAAPCSYGKTRVAAKMLLDAQMKGKRGIFICDRIKLVEQSMTEFESHGLHFGVIQGNHWKCNPAAPVQIASIQTLARRKVMPEFDFAIVDECHVGYKTMHELMDRYNNLIFVGLSATPYAKGMGKVWDDLVVPITPNQLLDQKYLTPVRYYGGAKIDLHGLKSKRTRSGAMDYDPEQLAARVEQEHTKLTGDIIGNFKQHCAGRSTVAFTPSIKQSQWLCELLRSEGITAAHIDGYMDEDERQVVFDGFRSGLFQVISCSQLLSTGWDAPFCSAMLDLYPTKSLITHVQKIGRVMRTCDGKVDAVVLDFAGNCQRHGFCEDIVPDQLDMGVKQLNERTLTKEKTEPKIHECPICKQQFKGVRCPCGFQFQFNSELETDKTMLVAIKGKKTPSMEEKQAFYSGLLAYSIKHKFKVGYAAWQYKDKFGVWPVKIARVPAKEIPADVLGWIQHQSIKKAKSKQKRVDQGGEFA